MWAHLVLQICGLARGMENAEELRPFETVTLINHVLLPLSPVLQEQNHTLAHMYLLPAFGNTYVACGGGFHCCFCHSDECWMRLIEQV